MPSNKTAAVKKDQLNRMAPAARDAQLGAVIEDLIAQNNALRADVSALRAKYNAALAKLDLDNGVTDTNYAALHAAPALTSVAVADLSTR